MAPCRAVALATIGQHCWGMDALMAAAALTAALRTFLTHLVVARRPFPQLRTLASLALASLLVCSLLFGYG